MKRMIMTIVVAGLLLVAGEASAPRFNADAQDSTSDRVAALETTVSQQSATLAALSTRVAALERRSGTSNGGAATGELHDLTGNVTLVDSFWSRRDPGLACWGSEVSEGYSDIDAGMPITVKDESGRVIGTGDLQTGRVQKNGGAAACVFPFTIKELPDAAFYTLASGRRGELTYSRDELESRGWKVALSIGD